MWTLNSDLSVEGLKGMKRELSKISQKIDQANKICIDLMVEYGVQRAKQILSSRVGLTGYIPTGKLEESITGESKIEAVNVAVGRIYTDVEYAAYVEFGTGVRGSQSNRANSAMLDMAENNITHNTDWLGQYAKNFMWDTRKELEKMYPTFMEQAIKKVGG